MKLITTKQLAAKWRVSTTRIRQLAIEGRIRGAYKIGRDWHFDAHTAEVIPTAHQKRKAK